MIKEELTAQINCPFCDSDNGIHWATENGFNALKCQECGFIYVNPRPKRSIIKKSIEEGIHSYLANPRSKITRRMQGKIKIYNKIFREFLHDVWEKKEPIRWLDVGAGFGEIIQSISTLAAKSSYVEGVEPMPEKVAVARKLGINVKEGYLEQVHGKFDFISVINVFSHIDDISTFLKTCNDLLSESGEIILETGNAADLKSPLGLPGDLDLPDHLMFAGEKHITGFLERAGFKLINSISYRRDTVFIFCKSIIKKLLRRQVNIVFPYTSRYRTFIFRARKIV